MTNTIVDNITNEKRLRGFLKLYNDDSMKIVVGDDKLKEVSFFERGVKGDTLIASYLLSELVWWIEELLEK